MTEEEWLTCADPKPKLEFLRGKASERKLRLFAVACCRRIWQLLPDERSRHAVEVAERYADAQATEEELLAVGMDASAVPLNFSDMTSVNATEAALYTTGPTRYLLDSRQPGLNPALNAGLAVSGNALNREQRHQALLLRDLFGNPFRPIAVDPAWLTPTVVQLAQTIYDDRAFDRMPELADALHDAGCHDADILNHCRGLGPHVRGCWVVDLILGKQ